MNLNYIEYFCFGGDAISITKSLNDFREYTRAIKVISTFPSVTQLNQTIIVMIVELDFKSDLSKKSFNEKFVKQSNSILKKV